MAETKKTETKTVKSSETKAATTAKKTTTTKATTAKTATKKVAEAKVEAPVVETKAAEVEVKAAPAKAEKKGDMIKVTLVKSPYGRLENQTRTLKALGLKKTNSFNIVPDNAATRGMIFVVKHLVSVEKVK